MLYVFHVDTGTMMTFDINLALESVVTLKLKIEKVCDIPASSQVLLVSGGEVLRHEAKVCSYSAGTDTNPIYMFSKNIIESSEPPRSSCDYGSDVDLRNQVETCISMAANNSNYSTVVACSQLAQQFWEHAREHTHVCEKLVHDQHLQQQGWAAVVANMEDVTNLFQRRAEDFEQKFREHLKKKDEYSEFLSKFNEDLETLSSIPILPALRLNAVSNPFNAFDDLHADSESYSERHGSDDEDSESKLPDLEDGQKEAAGVQVQTDIPGTTGSNDGSSKTSSLQGTASEGDEDIDTSHEGAAGGDGVPSSLSRRLARGRGRQSTREALTLLHWITAKENQESLRDIAKYCNNALELLDDSVMLKLQTDVAEAMTTAGQEGMKKIKGLEERLSGLEHLMIEARRIEQEQKDLAFSFVQNQQKAANLGDVSVLRMLCESHCQQLQSMLKNQHKLKDVRVRCARAKEELAVNLYHRLKWIVYVENCMFETDSCLMFYHRSLTRLKKHLGVISQLHKAPKLFCTAVHEIVRRRTFSQAFLAWASDLASHLLTIHSEEVTRRRTFNSLFSGHFLGGLLPGTEDVPPPFATQPPPDFDTRLPRLTPADLQTLAARMPNLSPEIPPYDMTSVTQFFTIRTPNSEKSVEPLIADERILAVVREAAVDRGVESETDTEEFEKVGQSPMFDRSSGAPLAPPAAAPVPLAPCDASTLTEENLGSQREEVQNLKELLSSVSNICSQSICVLRDELGKLKTDSADNQVALKNHCNEILSAWDKCNSENAVRERETLQRLTVDHELEMNDIKQTLSQRDEEIRAHKLDIIALENKYSLMLQDMTTNINKLQAVIKTHEEAAKDHSKQIEEFELAKQKSIKELQEKMTQEFKAEVESLRSRFRLVALTSMDRSPSESSLEKIERSDMIEITNHKAILQQTKEDMEIEREEAVKSALERQEEAWNIKLADEFEKMRFKNESEKQINFNDAVRRIIDEKDRQLDQSRERETILLKECMKYKETIQQLTDPETSDFQSNAFMQGRLDVLEAQNSSLEQKLNEKSDLISTAVKEQQTDNIEVKDSSNNPPDFKTRPKSKNITPINLPVGLFSSASCNIGDTVLIAWDQQFNNFSVLQDSASLFLLHIDCLTSLDLKIPPKDEKSEHYYIGRVDNKDYCIAVKVRNRYNVPLGSRFYRVKVRPLKPAEILDKDKDFCCNITLLKEKECSHARQSLVGGMSVSAMVGGSGTSSRRESPMTKSVCTIRSESATSTSRRSDETIIISEDAEEHTRTEQPNSIEVNIPDASSSNDDQLVPCSHLEKETVPHLEKSTVSRLEKSTVLHLEKTNVSNLEKANVSHLEKSTGSHHEKTTMSHLEKSTVSTCSIHLNPLPAPPEESVPYEISKDGRLNEDLISEIAEEAAP